MIIPAITISITLLLIIIVFVRIGANGKDVMKATQFAEKGKRIAMYSNPAKERATDWIFMLRKQLRIYWLQLVLLVILLALLLYSVISQLQ